MIFRKKPQLSKVSVQTTDIPPREIVTYAKQTQTVASPDRGGKLSWHLVLAVNYAIQIRVGRYRLMFQC